MKRTFYIVDVFAEDRYSGNQLAVFLNAEEYSAAEMQKIAREMNFSETTFVSGKPAEPNCFQFRIFTPTEELPFAGHPTLGTAFVIATRILRQDIDEVHLRCPVGDIPVRFNYRRKKLFYLEMTQNPPEFGSTYNSFSITKILDVKERAIDSRFPIQHVSTGIPFIIVPMKSLSAVEGIRLDRRIFKKFVSNKPAKSILVFCPETIEEKDKLHVRVFAPMLGVEEDPATGSANGCLAAYLLQHKYFGDDQVDITVEQGIEMDRKSRLYLKASFQDNGLINVVVGGKVVDVAECALS